MALTEKDLNASPGSGDRWSHDPESKTVPTITIELKGDLMIALDCSRLKGGFPKSEYWPFPNNWELYGRCLGEWLQLDRVSESDIQKNGGGTTSRFLRLVFRQSMESDFIKQGGTSAGRGNFTSLGLC
jgi:hypothetical protein